MNRTRAASTIFSHSHRGMTLVEIMVVVGLVSLLSLGLLRFFIQALNIYSYDEGKIRVNKDIRSFTSEMTDNATYANYFLIFPSFSDRTRTEQQTDPATNVVSTVTVDTSVNDGQSGDMLVLVYKDPADERKVERLIGYYRLPANADDANSEGPVRNFDLRISPSSSAAVWTLLPAVSTATTWPEVIEISRGRANGKLFYNFFDRSIMVKGQIIHRGSQTQRATNTYNFTVSPRG